MLEHLEVYRVDFGHRDRSNVSELIAVKSKNFIEDAIREIQNNMIGDIINYDIVRSIKLEMTPTLFTN